VGFLIGKTLGPQVEELVHVSTLATTPEKQGQGYGTALMKETIKYVRPISAYSNGNTACLHLMQADDHGRGIFLETDTEYNVSFYESLGFKVIGETKLGEHNPTWHEKPVTVSLASTISLTCNQVR
jgi:GNAT superfamily N-acetyltransferase